MFVPFLLLSDAGHLGIIYCNINVFLHHFPEYSLNIYLKSYCSKTILTLSLVFHEEKKQKVLDF